MWREKLIQSYEHPIERAKLYGISAIEFAKSIIEIDPASHIDIPMSADKAGINAFKLTLGFRKLFRTRPYQYQPHLCLKKAKTLLEATDDTINQIASKVGFDSYNGFSTAFKKPYSIAPTAYRNLQSP